MKSGIDVRAAQLRRQQLATAEVKRQVAVTVVLAAEELTFLVAMKRIVGLAFRSRHVNVPKRRGRVEFEDDLLGRLVVGNQEEIDEQALDRRCVVADLVVAGGFGCITRVST
jgi:flagellar biosynthesis/type III secretory pathway ATPase